MWARVCSSTSQLWPRYKRESQVWTAVTQGLSPAVLNSTGDPCKLRNAGGKFQLFFLYFLFTTSSPLAPVPKAAPFLKLPYCMCGNGKDPRNLEMKLLCGQRNWTKRLLWSEHLTLCFILMLYSRHGYSHVKAREANTQSQAYSSCQRKEQRLDYRTWDVLGEILERREMEKGIPKLCMNQC